MVLFIDYVWDLEMLNFSYIGIFCIDVYNYDYRYNVGFLRDFNFMFYVEIFECKSLICKGYDVYFKVNFMRGLLLCCEIV